MYGSCKIIHLGLYQHCGSFQHTRVYQILAHFDKVCYVLSHYLAKPHPLTPSITPLTTPSRTKLSRANEPGVVPSNTSITEQYRTNIWCSTRSVYGALGCTVRVSAEDRNVGNYIEPLSLASPPGHYSPIWQTKTLFTHSFAHATAPHHRR